MPSATQAVQEEVSDVGGSRLCKEESVSSGMIDLNIICPICVGVEGI
jgi:hypothetical protein